MKPTEFNEQNKVFTAPSGMANCVNLPVFQDDTQIISCWEMTMDEKLALILNGKVWLGVCGQGQPPVWLSAQYPFVQDGDKDELSDCKVRLDRMIERKVNQFIAHCFREGIDLPPAVSTYSMGDILAHFLRFTFNLKDAEVKANADTD